MTRITNLLFPIFLLLSCMSLRAQATLLNPLNTVSQGSIMTGQTAVANGLYFFSGTDGVHGFEIWRSDGQPDGTFMLRDINTDPVSFEVPYAVGNQVFFMANDSVHGFELWASDGSTANTRLVRDAEPGIKSSYPAFRFAVNDKLYYISTTQSLGTELWVSDGTEAGTKVVKDIAPNAQDGVLALEMAAFNNRIFFAGQTAFNTELWVTDGTEAGTHLFNEIVAGPYNSFSYTDHIIGTPIGVFFTVDDKVHGQELWFTNGDSTQTHLVKDIYPTKALPGPYFNPVGKNYGFSNGKLFFIASDGTSNAEQLWVSDGTEAGTTKIKTFSNNFQGSTHSFVAAPQGMFFMSWESETGHELYFSDGTPDGTKLVKDIAPGPASGAWGGNPYNMAVYGNRLYFTGGAENSGGGVEIWSSDGTEAGTQLAVDVNPGPLPGNPDALNILGNYLMFVGKQDDVWQGLFRATLNTVPVREIAAADNLFRISPQPASGRVRISASEPAVALDRVVLVHPNGARTLCYDGAPLNTVELDCAALPGGVYALLVYSNGKFSSKKMVVVH